MGDVAGLRPGPRWRPNLLTVLIVLLAMGGLVAGLYPMSAAWLSSFNQSRVITRSIERLAQVHPSPGEQLELAHRYNEALTAGVEMQAGANVPIGIGDSTDRTLRYSEMLRQDDTGLMGRIRIPAIDVDLPIYHGTSSEVLLRGAGHLEGSHLPVGGEDTRSVITAHRGLATSTMFTRLNEVTVGDAFTVEVLGEVLSYRVRETRVIDPDDSGSLRAVAGEDLVTLVTCTPLGINSHRILVTGERVTPIPEQDLRAARGVPTIPGFPWWIVIGGVGSVLVCAYLVRRGVVDARNRRGGSAPAPGGGKPD